MTSPGSLGFRVVGRGLCGRPLDMQGEESLSGSSLMGNFQGLDSKACETIPEEGWIRLPQGGGALTRLEADAAFSEWH